MGFDRETWNFIIISESIRFSPIWFLHFIRFLKIHRILNVVKELISVRVNFKHTISWVIISKSRQRWTTICNVYGLIISSF